MPLVFPIAAAPQGWLAAGLIDAIGPLLVVAFWVIRQVLVSLKEQRELDQARKEAEEKGQPWPPEDEAVRVDKPALEQAAAPEQNPGAPKPAQADLRSEVEEFLRRASQGNAAPAAPPTKKPPLDPFDEPPRRQRRQTPPAPAPKPRQAEVQIDSPRKSPARRESLRHLPESQLAEHAAHLGETIGEAEDREEARRHEKFDNRLGTLMNRPGGAESAPVEPKPANAASRIKKALASPSGAREAVILSEILRSPVERF